MGWSPDEYEAAGVSWSGRGKRADELVRAIKTIWTTNPVEFRGEYVQIAKSFIDPKPVQKPHPPIYMAAYAPTALQRVARESNGWFPAGIPIEAVSGMFERNQGNGKGSGPRIPSGLEMIVRGNPVELLRFPGGRRSRRLHRHHRSDRDRHCRDQRGRGRPSSSSTSSSPPA